MFLKVPENIAKKKFKKKFRRKKKI